MLYKIDSILRFTPGPSLIGISSRGVTQAPLFHSLLIYRFHYFIQKCANLAVCSHAVHDHQNPNQKLLMKMRRATRSPNSHYTLRMQSASVTRGYGLLEHFLSRKRIAMANVLIGDHGPRERILDIGCGSFPLFLEQAPFREKFGIDRLVSDVQKDEWARRSVVLIERDVDREPVLQFRDDYFDVVTMLAVFEHIEKSRLVPTVSEIRRVLRPGGIYVLTTPAQWTDRILSVLSRVRLVSQAEIEEHKGTYTRKSIMEILFQAGFSRKSIITGSFECGMNLWAKATKTS